MTEVVVGGLFALVTAVMSGWAVDGGMRRRARRAIREEYELAETVDATWVETKALRDLAQRRLYRYVTPLSTRLRELSRGRRALAVPLIAGPVGVLLATISVLVGDSGETQTGDLVWAGLAVLAGGIAGAFTAVIARSFTVVLDALSESLVALGDVATYVLFLFGEIIKYAWSLLSQVLKYSWSSLRLLFTGTRRRGP